MEDDIIPGNFGSKDQATALLWIQRYISDYGGDPDRVTISGESSGAVDASLHLCSPLSQRKSNLSQPKPLGLIVQHKPPVASISSTIPSCDPTKWILFELQNNHEIWRI